MNYICEVYDSAGIVSGESIPFSYYGSTYANTRWLSTRSYVREGLINLMRKITKDDSSVGYLFCDKRRDEGCFVINDNNVPCVEILRQSAVANVMVYGIESIDLVKEFVLYCQNALTDTELNVYILTDFCGTKNQDEVNEIMAELQNTGCVMIKGLVDEICCEHVEQVVDSYRKWNTSACTGTDTAAYRERRLRENPPVLKNGVVRINVGVNVDFLSAESDYSEYPNAVSIRKSIVSVPDSLWGNTNIYVLGEAGFPDSVVIAQNTAHSLWVDRQEFYDNPIKDTYGGVVGYKIKFNQLIQDLHTILDYADSNQIEVNIGGIGTLSHVLPVVERLAKEFEKHNNSRFFIRVYKSLCTEKSEIEHNLAIEKMIPMVFKVNER